MRISGKTRLAGIMGWPVGHSRSPLLHCHWLAHHRIDGAYVPLPVTPENLGQALRSLPALGFAGVNLTLPHKESALGHLDRIDDMGRRIGAVNTVVVAPDGSILGSNTDGFGFLANLQAGAPEWRAPTGPAVVIGAGGAARAVCAALVDAGAPEIRIVNRTGARAVALARDMGPGCTVADWSARAAVLAGASLLVNATSLGMTGEDALDLVLDRLPLSAVVNDIVYIPLETPLLAAARARGHTVVDGLGMLLHQGRPGFRAWFGAEPAVTDALRREMLADLGA
jgi:shikimate dehydrogenase